MKKFNSKIKKDTLKNKNSRKVLYTSKDLQLILMSLKPGEEFGLKTHNDTDQFFRFESGIGKCIINEYEYNVSNGDVIVVPAGSKHNVINTGTTKELQIYRMYTPHQNIDDLNNATKKDTGNF